MLSSATEKSTPLPLTIKHISYIVPRVLLRNISKKVIKLRNQRVRFSFLENVRQTLYVPTWTDLHNQGTYSICILQRENKCYSYYTQCEYIKYVYNET